MKTGIRYSWCIAFVTAMIVQLLVCLETKANTYTVTNGNDAGAGSLRQAIINANAGGAGPHSIIFTISGTINLASALPAITNAGITLDGGNTVTVSANVTTDVARNILTINAGGNNTVIKNVVLQNTGSNAITIAANLSGITVDNVTIRNTANDFINYGIYVAGTSNNMTIHNVTMTDIQDACWGIRFVGAVNNLKVDGYHIYNGTGNAGHGIQIQGAATGVSIKNSNIDLDDPATTDDGDYGIYFNTTVNGLTIDSNQFHDNEIYAIYVGGAASNVSIRNNNFDNLDGWVNNQMVYFAATLTSARILNDTFNGKMRAGTDRGNQAMFIYGNSQRVIIQNCSFTDFDDRGIYAPYGYNTDSLIIDNNTFTRIGTGAGEGAIEIAGMRSTASDVFPILITNNRLTAINGIGIYLRPGDGGNYTIPNTTVAYNTITGQKSAWGAIRFNYIDKIKVTQNSIYGNQGIALDLAGAANCGYEGATYIPQLISSTETSSGSGVYNIAVKMPATCGTGNCSLELFATPASVVGAIGGEHYITTVNNLHSGNNTLSNITGNFPEVTAAPYGRWTATLRVVNNGCGTSEYSNKLPVKVNGPAGVDSAVQLWLNPDFLDDGNMVNGIGWEDFSGNSKNFDVVVSDPSKAVGLNYNNYVDFDGNDYFASSASPFVTAYTSGEVISVLKSNSNNANRGNPYDFGGNSNSLYTWSNGGIYSDFGTNDRFGWNPMTKAILDARAGVSAVAGTAINPMSWNIYGTHSAANNWGVDFNGGQQTISSAVNTVNFTLGNREYVGAVAGYIFYGDISEEVLYKRVLTAVERQRINSYLAVKYGLTLSQNYLASDGTTTWWNLTANTGYNKGIAGIARDDRSVLYQRQSKSVSASDVVSIGVGDEILTSNLDNDATIATNKSAFMWGTDSASTLYNTAFVTSYSDARMTRTWRVRKTNWTDTLIIVQLQGGNENRTLLVSSSPAFTSGVASYPLNDTGTVVLNSSLIPDGAYFTFANRIVAPACVTAGIKAWYKGDRYNPATGVWPDVSGYDNNASGTANYPVTLHNFNEAVDFNGLNMQYLPSIYSSGTFPFEMFIMSRSAANVPIFAKDNSSSACNAGPIYYADGRMTVTNTAGANITTGTSVAASVITTPHINNTNRTSAGLTAMYVNNTLTGTATIAQQAGAYGQPQLGGRNDYGCSGGYLPQDVEIPEAVFYSAPLSASDRLKVNSYLAFKYGVTLNQTAPTDYMASDGITKMWDATANATYNKDIAGIGKDSCSTSLLYQKQSHSVNAGAPVTLSVGDQVFYSNRTNPYSIINNRSFLVWGDNGNATAFVTPVTASSSTVRMARIWKVDKTNWADQEVTMKYSGSVRNLYLLISNSNSSFTTIDQEIQVNETDSTVTFNSSLLPDGAYFTFGKQILGPGYVNSGVRIWLRADDGSASGATWSDFSGNGNDVSQATVTAQPTLSAGAVNYNPAMTFNGTNNVMTDADGILGAATYTASNAFVVTERNVLQVGSVFQEGDNSSYYLNSHITYSNGYIYWDAGPTTGAAAGRLFVLPSAFNSNVPYLHSMTASTGVGQSIYQNGLQIATDATMSSFTTTSKPFYVGQATASGAYYYSGKIAEVAIYGSAITAGQRQKIESYLAIKYGISLDQTSPRDYIATDSSIIWKAADNIGYTSNIAGIGRDDMTGQYQKQSGSSSDSLMVIAAGDSVAVDNVSNMETLDDLSFFVWANNNAAITYTAALTGLPHATLRMPRVWKVDRTDSWTDRDITFKVTKGGDRYLLINATDPTFGATGTTEYPLDVNTGSVTVNTANIPDGAYFTFATRIIGPGGVNANVQTWLRSDYAAAGNSWVDFSGNQKFATQATAGNQPVYGSNGINFNPSMNFDGNADYMDFTGNLGISGTNNFTVFSVTRRETSGTADAMLSQQGITTNNFLSFFTAANNYGVGATNVATAASSSVYGTVNIPYMAATTRSGNNFSLYVDGNADGGGTATWSFPATAMRLGNRATSADVAFDGDIDELVVYNRALTSTEMQRVQSYLALKYGMTLSHGTQDYLASDGVTKMWTAADNVGYTSRITGVGRDDSSALYQKQSRSADTGLVTISMGLIAADNKSNPETIDSNNSFLVFADNASATIYSTSINAPISTYRMNRVWKVDKSSNWSDKDITLKLGKRADGVYLVTSSSPSFVTVDQELPLSAADSTVNLNTGLLPDGEYFTFASRLYVPGGVAATALWLRPDIGISVADSIAVDTWPDNSPSGNDALQATVANQPLYRNAAAANINFNPVMQFAGTPQSMTLDISMLPLTNTARTIIGIGVPANVTGVKHLIGWGANAALQFSGIGANAAAGVFSTAFTTHSLSGAAAWTAGLPNEMFTTYTGGTNGATHLYSKLKEIATSVNLTLATSAAGTASVGNGGGFWTGTMGDIIVYNRELSTLERQLVSSYLAVKYGYSLDQATATNYLATDTTVIWNATANAAYKNGVTGIGRDDVEALLQKQSRNTDTTRMRIAIGVGTLAEANTANAGEFPDDKSYLLWGDDNGSLTYQTSLPGSDLANYRMARVWKAQEKGSVGMVQIAIPATAVPNQDEAFLVVSNDAVFDSTDNFIGLIPVQLNGSTFLAGTVDIVSGQYFTFASDIKLPGGVATPALWLRADKGIANTVDGTPLSVWNDYANQVNNAQQATVAAQPSYKNNSIDNINFNPVATFDGAADEMDLDVTKLPSGNTARSVIGIATPTNATAIRHLISWGTPAAANQFMALGVNTAAGAYLSTVGATTANAGNDLTAASFWSAGTPNELMMTWAGGTGNAALYSRQKTMLTPAARTWNTITTGTRARIGSGGSGSLGVTASQFWQGNIGEMIVYNKELTALERQLVGTYLAVKYGYTIDQTTPANYLATDTSVIWDATANAAYKYGITGVGFDEQEGLNQKQSRNTDTIRLRLVVGAGNIAETNADNTSSFGSDISYLLWGDDNGATTFKTPMTGNSNINYRMGRTWKVQETGLLGDVQVAIPYDALPNPSQSYLVVSNDNVFDATDSLYPLSATTINGKRHYAATVDFESGQYFSIASYIKSPGGVGITSLWLRADKGIVNNTDSTPVDVWVDYANEVNNGSQPTATSQAIFRDNVTDNANFNPVMKFDGTNDNFILDITKLPVTNAARSIAAYGMTTTVAAGQRYMLGWGANAAAQYTGVGANAAAGVVATAYTTFGQSAAALWTANVPNELLSTYAGGTAGAVHLYSKAKEVATATTLTLNTLGSGTAFVGSASATDYWNGKIGDIIVFDRELNLNERLRVNTYLSVKYGYTIDQTSGAPYIATNGDTVWSPAVNGSYKFRIAGVGRDDVEGLDQRQSRSLETGAMLTFGNGSIVAANSLNTDTFATDTTYVMIADNNGATIEQTTDIPASIATGSKRLGREWKAEVTGLPSAMQMKFDLTGLTVTGTVPSDFSMIIDNDGDGDFTTGTATVTPATAFAANTVTFDNIAIPDGAVFTLVTKMEQYKLNVKVFLQGDMPSSGTTMHNDLQDYFGGGAGLLPVADPYGAGASYSQINDPAGPAGMVTDWVKVDVRDAANPLRIIETNAFLLKPDGTVRDITGAVPVLHTTSLPDSFCVSVSHRNHLMIMSKGIKATGSSFTYDFTTALSQVSNPFGDPAQMVQKNGVWCMWAGDINMDWFIDGTDYGTVYFMNSVSPFDVYDISDLNMDGFVDGTDLGLMYFNNSIAPYSTLINY
ncbi:LamG-like jellyroll fold domain-containing protein [Chitinophagaceae bacterium MMS25-I14]